LDPASPDYEPFEVPDDELPLLDFVDEEDAVSDVAGALGSEVSVFRGPGAPPVPLP
jgi:hypothetical protein